MRKILILILGAVLAATQAFAAPNLFVNGSLVATNPVSQNYSDLYLNASSGLQVEFTLLSENTSYANRNTLYLHNFNSSSIYQTIFDDNESAGASHTFNLNGQFGFSLFSDVNDNGSYNGLGGDKWLYSNRQFTSPDLMLDDNYQFFRAYNTSSNGFANYRFENGNLQFSGDYDFLLFIDDRQDGLWNYDHNDMVVAGRIVSGSNPGEVPEPTTLVLLGAGLAAIGAVRRKFAK